MRLPRTTRFVCLVCGSIDGNCRRQVGDDPPVRRRRTGAFVVDPASSPNCNWQVIEDGRDREQ
jgi:hypothetical protein